ncbi:HNH endonuclease signature motif containing protein [Arthrobacter sp. H5]|uniref:HNH endonuclease signature motif containing protein n=1 Tax=Arthrobacter sp. H5 TaxID=1267973 RepID=UPI00047F7341|nr:HNH endonuclease signature motif containing protein [Arthrobacter sp. H5]
MESAQGFDAPHQGLTSVWEGSAAPAPAGPRGSVHLLPVHRMELSGAVDALVLVEELKSWAEAQTVKLTDRIRELIAHEIEEHADAPRSHGAAVSAAAGVGAGVSASTAAGASASAAAGVGGGAGVRQRAAERDELAVSVTAAEIGAALRLPHGTARTLVERSRLLLGPFARTLGSLEAGKLSWRHTVTVLEESLGVPREAQQEFEEKLLAVAEHTTVAQLNRRARRLRERAHPESITARKAKAVKDRGVTVDSDQDGMAWLNAYLPAEQALGIYNRVDAAARKLQCPDEPRTLSQLRADVFTDVLTHTCTGDPTQGTGHRGIAATVFVTVPALTLLGRHKAGCTKKPRTSNSNSNSAAGNSGSADSPAGAICECGGIDGVSDLEACAPGLLDGYIPIDPETARMLAGHAASFTRILTHPETGAVLSVGRDSYRPPKHLQNWARLNNPTCIHPGCNRSSWCCDLDHTTPWANGGHTALCNLKPRCKFHHMLKTENFWKDQQIEPGLIQSTSLAGKTYTTLPEPPPPF